MKKEEEEMSVYFAIYGYLSICLIVKVLVIEAPWDAYGAASGLLSA